MSLLAVPSRYALVSFVCLLTHNLVMITGAALRQPIPVAVSVSFTIVVVMGYMLHSRFTFAVSPSRGAFLRYGAAMAANLPASTAIIWMFARVFGWPMMLAAPASTATMIGINFFLSRRAITPRVLVGRVR